MQQKIQEEQLSKEFPKEDISESNSSNCLNSHKKDQKKSCDKQQILEYFLKMQTVSCQRLERLREKLGQEDFIDKKTFGVEIEKTIESKIGNCYVFSVSNGFFQTKITMLKINMKQNLLQRQHFASGGYSSIFTQKLEKQTYVIKSQKITEESIANFDKKFDEILQEYFIYKLASILEFGPKMKNLYGFDIVCFNDSLEFSMQLCKIHPLYSSQLFQECESDLFTGMKMMHTLQIVHRDIKSHNIGWSPSFKKWVFLDFGFSSFIEQKPGEKTFTSYKGTYEFSSKQLQNLYYLKESGYVDLYYNDLHGIKTIKINFFQRNLNFVENSNSSLFSQIISLCKMKQQILKENFAGMERVFCSCLQLRQEFLKLITIQLDRQKLRKKESSTQLRTFYVKLKEMQFEEADGKNAIGTVAKERKKYFNLFIKEEQNPKSMWIFRKESYLRVNILQKWGQLAFMRSLFIFFSETLYSNSAVAWKRMKLLTAIIIKIQIPHCEPGNWLWNFHHILMKFEQKFLEQEQYDHLKQIFYCYYFFNDRIGQKRLSQILWRSSNEGSKLLLKMFCKLFSEIASFRSIDACRELFCKVKQAASYKNKKKNLYSVLERIAKLMLNFMLLKKNSSQKIVELDQLLLIIKERAGSSRELAFIVETVESWLSKFSALFYQEGSVKKHKNLHFSQNKRIFLCQIMDKINIQISQSERNLQSYFRAYPLLEEIPNKFTFMYYLGKRDLEKINEISENIISFNKDCLEEITQQLQYLHSRWDHINANQLLKEKKSVLKFFLASFKNRLSQMKLEVIQKYWEFYSMSFKTDDYFVNDSELKEQVVSSLKHIIGFFTFQDLSASNKVYIHLFISLKMFLEKKIIRTDQFLEQLQKNLLIQELKENKRLLLNFTRVFPFYQISAGKYCFHKTQLFHHISETKMLNWLFYESPLFFSNTINVKVSERKPSEAFDLVISQTKYLSANELVNGKTYNIWENFIIQNCELKLSMIKYFLQSGSISCLRQNNYLSSFILIIYLFFEQDILNTLKLIQIQRVYTLSAISIEKLPDGKRIQLRKMLKYKFRDVFKKLKHRKIRILNRQEDYSRDRLVLLMRSFEKMVESKRTRISGRFKIFFSDKLQLVKQNLKMNDLSFQSKLKTLDYFLK